ncbi:uncharacterized protein CG5098-like isoform X2 [Onthophagus taurus]|uniref:uncharacterized protein CG5098-like isoform X2 n=1 Tax=Onthophagus taurus TaxID=166361 RepID=UPI0039BE0011
MSGPPHHSHNRQPPPGNPAWNHLQVPNFFPRQPQHAHMSNEHHLTLHQPTWHTPTTEPAMKTIAALPHVFNLDQMLTERSYRAGVDLTLTRNGNQNGDVPSGPISLSVRDTNKINSLPPGALGIQGVELTKSLSPGLKSLSPGLKSSSPGLKSNSPGVIKPMSPALSTSPGLQDSPKTNKKKRMDSVLEKLNTTVEKNEVEKTLFEIEKEKINLEKQPIEKSIEKSLEKPLSVLVQGPNDENSNSSSTINAPTPTNDDLLVSPYSNEDSLDSNKSRRKRKPSKTVRVAKEPSEKPEEKEEPVIPPTEDVIDGKINEKVVENEPEEVPPAKKPRRKTSSESETIEKIASMVQEVVQDHQKDEENQESNKNETKIDEKIDDNQIEEKNVENNQDDSNKEIEQSKVDVPVMGGVVTAAQRKATNFVEVENKLEEMFAGIVEDPPKPEEIPKSTSPESPQNENLATSTTSKIETTSEEITSTNNDENALLLIEESDDLCKTPVKKGKLSTKRRTNTTPKKKKGSKAAKVSSKTSGGPSGSSKKDKKSINGKIEVIKDVYAYDSGSNTSSVKSRGPFVHIEGTRDSPVSVSIINTATEEDNEKKNNKLKKFHDDSEYRHKVRSKGLHCSTLSNKYDAQTKDVSWICVFCKRGPHSTDVSLLPNSNQFYPPGDLFGPYVITNNCPEFERKLNDPYDKQFKSKKIARVLDAQNTAIAPTSNVAPKISKKSKRKHHQQQQQLAVVESSENRDFHDDFLLGITATSEKTFEIWTHEDCVVWSPGVYLVGPKIVGLEEAVWTSCNVICVKCGYKGANLCCLRRGCTNVVHFGCGVVADWALDYDSFRAYCVEHKSMMC